MEKKISNCIDEDTFPREIESISFATLSRVEILQLSEIEVRSDAYYMNGKPVDSGLLDSRMGPPNTVSLCQTCGGNFHKCPGHYGRMTLAFPVYNVGYLDTVVDIMKCICKNCSKLLLNEDERQSFLEKLRNEDYLKKKDVAREVVKKCNSKGKGPGVACSTCGHINVMVERTGSGILHSSSKLDARTAYCLLKNIRDEDCRLLYPNDRPEKLVVTDILVPPTTIRPSVIVGDGSIENDISERLKLIIMANARLRSETFDKEDDPTIKSPKKFLEYYEDLQANVTEYINSFVQRLKGQHRTFLGNQLRKSVEFTGRTVISPDPNLKITEVGVPMLMARTLTYPERVSHHNIEKLRRCVRNGPFTYPGALSMLTPGGSSFSLKFGSRKNHANELSYGCIVNRFLEEGDVILLNRVPILHQMSLMSHRAKIIPYRTLTLNPSICNAYSVHFDGSEMNLHVPQTEEARTEALMLLGVQNNLCTPKNGEILIASTQDVITSLFLITRKDTFYDRSEFALLCSYIGDAMDPIDLPTPALVKPVELWTGKQLFSVLLRPSAKVRVYLNLTVAEKGYGKSKETMCSNDGFVHIRNSELISGQLGEATLGNRNKEGIFHVLLTDYGPHAAATCMTRLSKLSSRWIGNYGFSIGIDGVQPGDVLNKTARRSVWNSFYSGLSATDFISDTMKGRERLVDAVVKPVETGYVARRLMKAMEDLRISYDHTVRNANDCIIQFSYGSDSMDPAQMEEKSGLPLNLERLFLKAKATCPATEKQLTREEVERIVNEKTEDFEGEDGYLEAFAESLRDFTSHISETTQQQLLVFLETCITRFHSKIIQPGTAVGAIAAQSIGERGTQMPLKTFHFTGVENIHNVLGIPRMKEIITAANSIKTPIITATLECDNNEESAEMVKRFIETTLLEQVAESCIGLTARR